MKHCLTIDVEDWYHYYPIEKWDGLPARIEEPLTWILNQLSIHRIKATFFVLGYIAERHPGFVKKIFNAGHEIACHGYDHRPVFEKTPQHFDNDIKKALKAIENAIGIMPDLYRAPLFSITKRTQWVWSVLYKNGIRRDSSLFGAKRFDGGGFTNIHSGPFKFKLSSEIEMCEYPIIPIKIMGINIPFSGGGYLRLLPINQVIRWARKSTIPVIFYIHPRDIDVGQPVIKELSLVRKWMVYYNIDKCREKFIRLVNSLPFTCMRDAYIEYKL